MLNLLRFAIFFMISALLLLAVVLPALISPVLTEMVRDAGIEGDDLRVSIGIFDPSLLNGRAAELRIEGRNVTLGPATAGGIDLTLSDVSLFGRTFAAIGGNLRDVTMSAGGVSLIVARVEISGPARAATVVGRFSPVQGTDIVRQAARRAGFELDRVELVDGGLRVSLAGRTTRATVSVEGGGLVLRPESGPNVLLLAPAPTDPWRLTDAWISAEGITIRGVIDAAALAQRATSTP